MTSDSDEACDRTGPFGSRPRGAAVSARWAEPPPRKASASVIREVARSKENLRP
jgi:hypothetical protein